MISQETLDKLRGAAVRVIPAPKGANVLTGTLRVVDHDFPIRGQTLNLEVETVPGKRVTLQLTGSEARQLTAAAEGNDLEFRWNGKPRPLRPVTAEDMIPVNRESYVSF